MKVLVVGHTDNLKRNRATGPESFDLSRRRVAAGQPKFVRVRVDTLPPHL